MTTRKKDLTAEIVVFFATAPLDEAQRVLASGKSIIAQRTRTPRRNKIAVTTHALGEDAHQAATDHAAKLAR